MRKLKSKRKYYLLDERVLDNIYNLLAVSYGDNRYNESIILHREKGPAITYPSKYKAFFQYGLRHRINGPAVEYSDGKKLYFLFGESLSKKAYLKKLKDIENITVEYLFADSPAIRKIAELLIRKKYKKK